MVITQKEFKTAMNQINQAFAASGAKIAKLEEQVKALEAKAAPKKVAKSA